ncbi:MAG: 3-deoxy-manno-octulosonate cytidylyltransferase, partial [Phycisphaerae bacterium]|nr:3-deoxy-manno-octulosonate cytidylyltransferase [Phycisphaerae bacterium]
EKLEQLRILEHGYRIKVIHTSHSPKGIDTPEAYAEFVKRYQGDT